MPKSHAPAARSDPHGFHPDSAPLPTFALRKMLPGAMHEASVAGTKPTQRRMGYPHGDICTTCYRQSTKHIEEGRCVGGWGCSRKRD